MLLNKHFFIFLLAILVSGCASVKKPEVTQREISLSTEDLWNSHRQRVSSIRTWEAQGRIAAAHQGEGGNASFIWRQDVDFYKIRMFGPFGAGSAELTGSNKQVVFEESGGKTTLAETPEQLVLQATGLIIPVRGLAFWIKGIPASYDPIDGIEYNTDGQIKKLYQSGWNIDYQSYMKMNQISLPSRMTLQRDNVRVKLIVKQWQL